ncbi:MAG: hypothetical protein ACRC8Y_25540, partial [Chroococcales cyanobacterium]
DAACVGESTPESLNIKGFQPLIIKAMGRGSRQMVKPDKYGFPRTSPKLRQKSFYGFQTGDIVKAIVTQGKKLGTYVGRVAAKQGASTLKPKLILFKESVTNIVGLCINPMVMLIALVKS